MSILTTNRQVRKNQPIATGVLAYFPNALAEVAYVSVVGNKQHNGDEPLHWARHKSDDHADSAVRHLIDRGTIDVDGVRHTAKAAWRILALLQLELEQDSDPTNSESGWPESDVAVAALEEEAEFRTPVFATTTDGPLLYYYVADNDYIIAFSVDNPIIALISVTYDDLEALYDGVEEGTLVEMINRPVDLDACGTIDGSQPLPGYEPEVEIINLKEQLAHSIVACDAYRDEAAIHKTNLSCVAQDAANKIAELRKQITTLTQQLAERIPLPLNLGEDGGV